jgi:hypothetical protein
LGTGTIFRRKNGSRMQGNEAKNSARPQFCSDHFTGTRCFSSSNQFTTMLIFRGISTLDLVSAEAGLIIRNFLASGLISQKT